ncbi:MAG TPA: EAL domain-containing protein [Bacteroidetes bacterium]|nr:EAL domain-containing protein [Bacteroidota bacterium]
MAPTETRTLPSDYHIVLDASGHVIDASEGARALFAGAPLDAWTNDGDRQNAAAVIARVISGEVEQAGIQVTAPDGSPIWMSLRVAPGAPGQVLGFVRPGRMYRPTSTSAQADRLRLLATVTTHSATPFRERLERALRLTSELLSLPIALVSRIEGETYTVFAAQAPGTELAPGDQFELANTFCSVTIESDDVIAINGVGETAYRVHPCYEAFALESYVGVSVEVRGEKWGTLTFSSSTPLSQHLAPADHDLIRLLALWVGGEIEREEDRHAIVTSEQRYRALSHATFEGIAFSVGGTITDCNRQFATLLGYDAPEDLIGRSAFDMVAPDSREKVGTMIREGRTEPYEARVRRQGSSPFWAEIQGRHWTLDGKVIRVTAIRDVSQRRALSDQLEYQATHDALTGLPNRTLFYSRVQEAIEDEIPFAALFIDLDRFKVVNDSLGHEMGDFLLATVAERLRRVIGSFEGSTVARLGGDEFAMVVPTQTEDGPTISGREIGVQVLEALNQPVDLGPREHEPGASIGVIEQAETYATPEDVLRDADTAMYEAKRSGRGRTAAFVPALRKAARDRFRLEHDLRRAIHSDELRLYMQPVVKIETGEVVGFESLVRWQHPTRGLLAPGAFLPLAEELSLVMAIDEWVLDATAAAVREKVASGSHCADAILWLSLNCSDATFLSGNRLRERVRQAIQTTGLPPSRFVLELTERAVVEQREALHALDALHSEGVQVCVDDFGTGFSSLGLLSGLPVDGFKIDRSFVTDLGTSPQSQAVVRGVVGIARDLGLRVVAEGVETEEQRLALAEAGCELAQGYFFARPLPAADAMATLR